MTYLPCVPFASMALGATMLALVTLGYAINMMVCCSTIELLDPKGAPCFSDAVNLISTVHRLSQGLLVLAPFHPIGTYYDCIASALRSRPIRISGSPREIEEMISSLVTSCPLGADLALIHCLAGHLGHLRFV